MKLPNAAAGRAALTNLYDDSISSTRKVTVGNTKQDQPVLSGVKCHLSFKKSKLLQGENVAVVAPDYAVYLPITADVQTGDNLTVTHNGQTFTGKAGLPVRGSLSLVVPMTEVKVS